MAEQLEVNSSTDLLNDFLSQGEGDDFEPLKPDTIIDGGLKETETIIPTVDDTLDITNVLPDDLIEEEGDEKEIEGDAPVIDGDSKYSFKALASVLSEEGLIDFEDSEELEDTPDLLYNSIKNTVQKEVQSYKDSIPEKAKQIIEYLEKGGDLDSYLEAVQKPFDIKNIDLTNESAQEKVVREYLKLQEYSTEEIEETITDYKDSLILEKQAKVASNQISKAYAKQEQYLIAQQEAEAESRAEEYSNYQSKINTTIDTAETLAGLPVDKNTRLEFKKYLLQADKNGQTAYAKELAEDPVKSQLELAYLKFLKFDFSKAVKQGETQATQKFKNIFKTSETNIKTGKSVDEAKSSGLSAFEQFKNTRNKQ